MGRVPSSTFYGILALEDNPPRLHPKKFCYQVSLGNTECYISPLKFIQYICIIIKGYVFKLAYLTFL